VQYLGIDWGTRRAAWCSLTGAGEISEGAISGDEDGLMRLVARLGLDVRGCIEMMSGAPWVRDRLAECGWRIEIADARKVKAIAPLACKTDRVDAVCWPSSSAATWSRPSGWRRSMTARSVNGCAGART
jgi:hypothetical protein